MDGSASYLEKISRNRLTRPYLQLLVKRKLHSYMCDAQETGEQTTVKGSDTFCPVYCPRGVDRVPVPRLVPRLSLNVGSAQLREISLVSLTRRTMNLVLMTHKGFVNVVLIAPAIIADIICSPQGCSLTTG